MSFFAADDLAVLWQLQCKVICFKAPPSPPQKKKSSQPLTTNQRTKYPADLGDVSRCFKAK